MELAGLRVPHHELIPEHVARKVAREIELADLLLVPSQFVAKQIYGHDVPNKKVAVIPYGVDLQAFHPPAQRDPKQRPLECLFVGHIAHRKAVRTLLESARRCRNLLVRFRLIGPIVSPEVLDDLPDNVRYEGATAPGGVAEAMRQADLFVLPTLEDSFALVVFEAMATALPVITTSHAGSSELIEHGEDGVIIPPDGSKALTAAIELLLDQPDLRVRLGGAARHKVQDAHSWESYGRSVLDAINSRFANT
jgi:glycosyltransferase involved in cell wall biosynthesis